jgi:hypothetical protein
MYVIMLRLLIAKKTGYPVIKYHNVRGSELFDLFIINNVVTDALLFVIHLDHIYLCFPFAGR